MPEGSEPTRAELDQTIAAEPEAAELLGAIRELSARVGGLPTSPTTRACDGDSGWARSVAAGMAVIGRASCA